MEFFQSKNSFGILKTCTTDLYVAVTTKNINKDAKNEGKVKKSNIAKKKNIEVAVQKCQNFGLWSTFLKFEKSFGN